jgi:hypothetical protein
LLNGRHQTCALYHLHGAFHIPFYLWCFCS